MSVNISDVARLAGVGRGTVSRVLNDRPNVDEATRDRVRAAIAELDYVPNPIARRLSLGRTQTIGVVVPYMTTASVVERLRGIESALVPAGYDMLVFNIESVERRDAVLREIQRRKRVDGLIVVSITPRSDEVSRILGAGVPIVLIDVHHQGLPSVVVDDVAGGRLAAAHLLELGHRHIAFLGDLPRLALGFVSSQRRLEGVAEELRAAGLTLPPDRIASGEHDRGTAADLTRVLLGAADRPTAIVCASDTLAMGAIEAIRGLGGHVPGDVSIVGYDDVELAEVVGLTTIRQPLARTGQRAVERLVAAIDGSGDAGERETLPLELVVRDTTGPPGRSRPRSPTLDSTSR